MFPAVRLPSFEASCPTAGIMGSTINESLHMLGYGYSIGLGKQMIELMTLAEKMFTELEEDFEVLLKRTNSVSSRITSFKAEAAKVQERLKKQKPQDYARNEYKVQQMPRLTGGSETQLEKSDHWVKKDIEAADRANPRPTLEAFASVVPNCAELDKRISDPRQFE